MLDWILEQQDVWQRLQSCRKPVVLYGMGDGAVKILRVMEQYGIRPAALLIAAATTVIMLRTKISFMYLLLPSAVLGAFFCR